MSASVPTNEPASPELPVLEGPRDLIDEYLQLVVERKGIEERLAYVRAELELFAAPALSEGVPRARFVGRTGAIAARLQATCVFDRANVARELQRMGKLSEVAILQGPGLARYLSKEPVVSARLGEMVRMRRSIVLTAADV